jgi:anaerobic selenocysteine-containing dehydrogenase
LKRAGARGSGTFEPIGWDEAIATLADRLNDLHRRGRQRALALWMRPGRGHRQRLIAEFLSRFGAPPPLSFELFSDDVLRRANLASFGREQLPTFDIERARYVLSFGADFLGTWNSPVAQNVAYGRMRQGRPGTRGKFVQVEARLSQTGANADEWVPIAPGTEGVLALGLAHVLMAAALRPASAAGAAGALIDGWNGGLAGYTPEDVQRRTGIAAARVDRLARELATGMPAVAIIGGAPLAHTNGLSQALAVNALNALLGAVDQPGGLFFTPQLTLSAIPAASHAGANLRPVALDALAAEMLNTPTPAVDMLLLDDANPVFATPEAWRIRDAIEKISFVASFGSFVDETNVLADLILPDHSPLESWIDNFPESGSIGPVASIAAPVMRPLHDTRSMPDVLLDVSRRIEPPLAPAFMWQTFDEMLQAAFGDALSAAQEQGGLWGETVPAAAIAKPGARPPARVSPVGVADPRFDGADGAFPFHLLPYASTAFFDGSLAHLPWLQELPDPMTSAMWSSWVEINPVTAQRLGIVSGDLVDVASQHGTIRAPALVWPGVAPDTVAMPVGQGHRTFTRYASGRGVNPVAILAPMTEAETGALAWAATRVKVTRAAPSDGSLVLFAGEMREHPPGSR